MKTLILNKDSNRNWFGGRSTTGSTMKIQQREAKYHEFEVLTITVIADHPIRYYEDPLQLDPEEVKLLKRSKLYPRNAFSMPYTNGIYKFSNIYVRTDCTGEVFCTVNCDLLVGDNVRLPMLGSGEVISLEKERYFLKIEIELDRYIEHFCQWKN